MDDADALQPVTMMLREAAQAVPLGVGPGLRADDGDWRRPHEILAAGIDATARRWAAPPHVAAALWWKAFSYWTALPVALGWALNRRIPAMTTDAVVVRPLPDAPYMITGLTEVRAVPGTSVRRTLVLDLHAPLIDALHALTRVGRRTLWGSVAEALVHPIIAYGDRLPGDPARQATALLEAAGDPVGGLVELPLGRIRRRTCCLWVTLPDREACETCCVG